MKISFYYVFTPTAELTEAARLAKVESEIGMTVWSDENSDRVGRRYSRDTIETSFWNLFLTQLLYDDPEPENAQEFRRRCVELGFHGCWLVAETWKGGDASEFVEESTAEAIPFLAKHAHRFKLSA